MCGSVFFLFHASDLRGYLCKTVDVVVVVVVSVGVNAVLLVMACVVYSCRDSQSGSLSLQLAARARMRMPTPTVPSLQRPGLGLKSLACQQARTSVSRWFLCFVVARFVDLSTSTVDV